MKKFMDLQRFKKVLNSIHNGIIVIDRRGVIQDFNDSAYMLLNIKADDAINKFVDDVLPNTWKSLETIIKTKKPQIGIKVKVGNSTIIANRTPIVDGNKVDGIICIFQDISEYERVTSELTSYKNIIRELDAIIEASSDGLWISDQKANLIRINRASELLNGVKAEEVVGKNMADIVEQGYIDRSSTLEVLESKRQVSILQYLSRTKKYLLATATPVFDEKGDLFLIVVTERDMTQLNDLKSKLQQSQLQTEKIKSEFAELSVLELKKQEFIAESKEMRAVLTTSLKLANLEASNILITGESGTGKGLLAKFIHKNSIRSNAPIIQINCAALPENLLEAELFGYEAGAFTGAREQGKVGLFELAHEGTLFLDEIGDLPFAVQAKLLKYLDDHLIMRLGGTKPKKVDCLIIAATNCNLQELSMKKKFREDLFFRLDEFSLKLPPLRERKDDIFELSHFYLSKYNKKFNQKKLISVAGIDALQRHPFPGNIRELKNIIKKAVVISDRNPIDKFLLEHVNSIKVRFERLHNGNSFIKGLTAEVLDYERELLKIAMKRCKTTREMAEFLRTTQSRVVRKMKKHRLSKR